MFDWLRNAFRGLSEPRLARRLASDDAPHDAGETTHLMWSVGVYGANAFAALARRTRRQRARLGSALRRRVDQVTATHLQARAWGSDPDRAGICTAHAKLAPRRATGFRRFLDVRSPGWVSVVIAIIILVVDYGFINGLARDLFSISFTEFSFAELGEFVAIWFLPLFFPVLTIALAERGGRLSAQARAARVHEDRLADMMPSGFPADGITRREPLLLWAMTAAIGVYFFAMATIRFGAAAEDAGLNFPAWLIAVLYGLLPTAAMLAVSLSSDPVLAHAAALERAVRRADRGAARLQKRLLAAHRRHHEAWFRLARLLDRIVADASQSIRLVEQLYAGAYARSGAIGPLAPTAAPPDALDEQGGLTTSAFGDPRLEPHRALSMPIPPWITIELERDLELLRAYRPDPRCGRAVIDELHAVMAPEEDAGSDSSSTSSDEGADW